MTPRDKWLALGSLVVVWIGLVYVYVINVPPPVEVPLTYRSGQTVAKSTPTSTAETWEVTSLSAQGQELPVTPTPFPPRRPLRRLRLRRNSPDNKKRLRLRQPCNKNNSAASSCRNKWGNIAT